MNSKLDSRVDFRHTSLTKTNRVQPRICCNPLDSRISVRRLAIRNLVERLWEGSRLIRPDEKQDSGTAESQVNTLVAARLPIVFEFSSRCRLDKPAFIMLSDKTTGGTAKTVSNTLADTVLIKTGSRNGDLGDL